MKRTLSLLLAAFALAATMTLTQDAARQPTEIVYDHLTSGMTYPKVVHQTFPQYTDHARKKKIHGVVLLSLSSPLREKSATPKSHGVSTKISTSKRWLASVTGHSSPRQKMDSP